MRQEIKKIKLTAQLLPNVFLIPQSPVPVLADFYAKMENGHYNSKGMKKLGQRFAEVFLNRLIMLNDTTESMN